MGEADYFITSGSVYTVQGETLETAVRLYPSGGNASGYPHTAAAEGSYAVLPTDRGAMVLQARRPSTPSPDRIAATHVLNLGGEVTVVTKADNRTVEVKEASQLPDEPFLLREVSYWGNRQVADADLESLETLTDLRVLSLGGTAITDSALDHIGALRSLEVLHLGADQISDAGMPRLEGLSNLSMLFLGNSQVTDAGLKSLTRLPKLSSLMLSGTAVSDTGLNSLIAMPALQTVSLRDTSVSDHAVDRLKQARPGLAVQH